jgi:hypothetical protein
VAFFSLRIDYWCIYSIITVVFHLYLSYTRNWTLLLHTTKGITTHSILCNSYFVLLASITNVWQIIFMYWHWTGRNFSFSMVKESFLLIIGRLWIKFKKLYSLWQLLPIANVDVSRHI